MKKTIGKKFFAKRQARKVVFSALYATLITGASVEVKSLSDVSAEFEDIDLDYFAQHSKRGGNTDVERAILQMAVAEMHASDLENRIVINEAIEITKEYGSDDGYKFINAVLDKIARRMSGVDE